MLGIFSRDLKYLEHLVADLAFPAYCDRNYRWFNKRLQTTIKGLSDLSGIKI